MHRALVAACLILGAIHSLAADARAQGLSGSIGNLAVDSDAPIHIESDTLEIDERNSLATFIGQVRAQQDQMQLTANELRVAYRGARAGASTQLRTIDAIGNVVVRVKDQVARGARAHYDFASETVTLSGDVVLSQGTNVIRGESIVVDLTTGRANMVSAAPGAGERVRGVFTPNRE
jgi:lipopolysaccharide export system protein LptA